MTNNSMPANRNRSPILLVGLVVVLAGGGVLVWQMSLREKQEPMPPPPAAKPSDLTAAMEANLRGVGKMEQFYYGAALEEFEEAVAAAPDWTPAQVNQGIALLNIASPEALSRAIAVLERVLNVEPDNIHAHYCLGIIAMYQGRSAVAFPHFEAVSRLDPNDSHTWLHMGINHPRGKDSAEAIQCFERALKLDPYLNAARYSLAQNPANSVERRKFLLDEFLLLVDARATTDYEIKYSKMGRYGEVIGRFPNPHAPEIGPLPMFEKWDQFQVKLAAGTTWAKVGDFTDLHKLIRDRFGATIVFLDFNKDYRLDIFLCSAVMRDNKLGDLLLRNDGNGSFTDVTAEAGLADTSSWGCAVADYNNDGFPDLLLTGAGPPRLYRNPLRIELAQFVQWVIGLGPPHPYREFANGKFANVSVEAGLDKLAGVFLSASWLDIDQDGDLDLLLARYAEAPEAARDQLSGKGNARGELVVFLNVGEAPAVPAGSPIPPLMTKFSPFTWPATVKSRGPVIGSVAGDFDNDRDTDVLILADGQAPTGIWNDRLLRFLPGGSLGTPANWNGAVLLDINHDQSSDLLLLPVDKPPLLWLSQKKKGNLETLADGFKPGMVDSPALRQALAVDIDLDTWTDVVGLTLDGKPLLLQNDGADKLIQRPEAFGAVGKALGIGVADLDGDGPPDLLILTDTGLELRRNFGNGNQVVRLDITGLRERAKTGTMRTNADGIGSWVFALTGTRWSGMERTRGEQAGLGRSSAPTELGVGKSKRVEVVRVLWPDWVPQAELNVAVDRIVRLEEFDRRPTSCPVLFIWDGERYRYVTDFLGAGSVGELGANGSTRPPRPEESIKIEPGLLAAKDGWYRLRITEPMDEMLYLDHLDLVAIDHPIGEAVYPDERFVVAGPPPTQELLHLFDMRYARWARDHRGHDVTDIIRKRDRRFVDSFHLRSWLGYAEEHWLEIDFGTVEVKDGDRFVLCLNGWTDYAFPESIFAASQAGIELLAPQLEYQTSDGKWKTWGELGFPAGLPRTMTRDVTELCKLCKGRFRIRTNMQVYWDQIYLARQKPAADSPRAISLQLSEAALRYRGFAKEFKPDGKLPVEYAPDRTEAVAVTPWKGQLTRYGDVRELLQKQDDRFVICGPGDEIEIAFDAAKLPPLHEGFARSFVLKSSGYCKDPSPFTATGGDVYPLPHRSMDNYPPRQPPPQRLIDYDRQWNRRAIGR